jgi:hypothetical protein
VDVVNDGKFYFIRDFLPIIHLFIGTTDAKPSDPPRMMSLFRMGARKTISRISNPGRVSRAVEQFHMMVDTGRHYFN